MGVGEVKEASTLHKGRESMPLTTYPVKYLKLHECVETLAQK